MSMHNIKGIIFDYGGTLDTNGVHWFHVFRQAYVKYLPDVTEAQLREAYVYAERYLATHRVIEPEDDFLAMLRKKVKIQITQLPAATSLDVERIAGDCDAHVRSNMEQTRQVLDALSARYPMVLVSNFYGNIHAVLRSYRLDSYFKHVIESAVVGVRKPDPRIFTLGIEVLGLLPEEVLVVGDSYSKDIVPAHTLGCRTLWLKGLGWDAGNESPDSSAADASINDLHEVLALTSLL